VAKLRGTWIYLGDGEWSIHDKRFGTFRFGQEIIQEAQPGEWVPVGWDNILMVVKSFCAYFERLDQGTQERMRAEIALSKRERDERNERKQEPR